MAFRRTPAREGAGVTAADGDPSVEHARREVSSTNGNGHYRRAYVKACKSVGFHPTSEVLRHNRNVRQVVTAVINRLLDGV